MSSADNAELFDQLLRPHLPRLYRLACRLTASKVDADDLFQEVLTRLYPRLDELGTLQHAPSWLGRVMYNQFIDNQRRFARQRLRMVEESGLAGGSIDSLGSTGDNLHDAVWREQIQTLDRALSALSEAHRLVVLLHDAEGYKLHEIQEITGDPLGTIKSRLHRARARLREILADDGTIP